MAQPITSAKQATEIAMAFVRQHYTFSRPLKASKKNGVWAVEIDVGAFVPRIALIEVDAQSGDIIQYDIPTVS